MKNPINTIDILKYHLNEIEDLLNEPVEFESKDEIIMYKRDILAHVISTKVILDSYFKV